MNFPRIFLRSTPLPANKASFLRTIASETLGRRPVVSCSLTLDSCNFKLLIWFGVNFFKMFSFVYSFSPFIWTNGTRNCFWVAILANVAMHWTTFTMLVEMRFRKRISLTFDFLNHLDEKVCEAERQNLLLHLRRTRCFP